VETRIGFDAGLFNDRVDLEFTYYDQRRTNALISVPVKPSTGFPGSQLRNIGEIQNTGFELGLNVDAYQGSTVGVEFGLALHTNRNEVLDLGGLDPIPVFGRNFTTGWTGQRHAVGFPLGSIFLPVVVSSDIVGTGRANPVAAVLSGAMMLDHLGETGAAERIRKACDRPESLAGTTGEIGDAIVARLADQQV